MVRTSFRFKKLCKPVDGSTLQAMQLTVVAAVCGCVGGAELLQQQELRGVAVLHRMVHLQTLQGVAVLHRMVHLQTLRGVAVLHRMVHHPVEWNDGRRRTIEWGV